MAHYSRICKVVIDVPAADHDSVAAFWGAAAGAPIAVVPDSPEYLSALLRSPRMWLYFQRLDSEESGPRVHLDIHTDDVEAEVRRLERLGATRVRPVHSWWVMRDPAGLLFCVIQHPPGNLDDSNAQRWE
ncbi:VOC family protein [Streptomyces aquilus]|uniref:Glyoxalase/bleomycin resistance/dioxygenase family protein n=1 Tax=Streptomyces aquilus TaxID=2548456 RepID=A0A3Q9C7K5_9ACTN|nr:VOC family protein [Streptomyces aquilus]AZP22687.1 glyoxalase/bleomycin resistance/dioxygenase family protein [Streptomyces aquilus]